MFFLVWENCVFILKVEVKVVDLLYLQVEVLQRLFNVKEVSKVFVQCMYEDLVKKLQVIGVVIMFYVYEIIVFLILLNIVYECFFVLFVIDGLV